MNSTCRPATSHFFLVKLCYAPPGSWLQCCAHVSQNEDEAPGAGLALGQQEGGHLVPALGHGAVDEGVSRHEVHAGLGQLLGKVSSACRWSDSCSEYCCCCPRSDSTDFLLHHEVGLFKLLLNINSKILNLHATKSFLWVSLHLRNHMMMTWRARETV